MSRFRIEGGGGCFNTKVYYGDEQILNVKECHIDIVCEDTSLRPEVTLVLRDVDVVLDTTIAYNREGDAVRAETTKS